MPPVVTLRDIKAAEAEETNPLVVTTGNPHIIRGDGEQNTPFQPMQLVELIFPYANWKSFVLLISVAQFIMFIVSLVKGSEFALIPSAASLIQLGANVPVLISIGQVYRLITPIFLHASPLHIFFNVFFQLRMGFLIERQHGILFMIMLYTASAIAGNILSAVILFCNTFKIGASTAGFGLIGLQMGELLLNWHLAANRERTLLNLATYLFVSILFLFSFHGERIDQLGHLGGFLMGKPSLACIRMHTLYVHFTLSIYLLQYADAVQSSFASTRENALCVKLVCTWDESLIEVACERWPAPKMLISMPIRFLCDFGIRIIICESCKEFLLLFLRTIYIHSVGRTS